MPIGYTEVEYAAEIERKNILNIIKRLENARTDNDLWVAISHLRAAYDQLDKFHPQQSNKGPATYYL